MKQQGDDERRISAVVVIENSPVLSWRRSSVMAVRLVRGDCDGECRSHGRAIIGWCF